MSLKQLVETAIRQVVPSHSEILINETLDDGIFFTVYWKLNNNPSRPNKNSKHIVIHIPIEIEEDYPNYPPEAQTRAILKIEQFLRQKFENFNPEHENPRYSLEPVENWNISAIYVFG